VCINQFEQKEDDSCKIDQLMNVMNILLFSRCNFTIITNLTNAKRANYNFEAALQFEFKIF